MAPLILAALLVAGSPGQDGTSRWAAEIDAAASRCGVPQDWIARVMQAESGGRTMLDGRPIRSPKGAIGLMQLMPATWGELRRDLGLGDDPDRPADNIVAGACYLRRMYDRFGYPGLFGAYNAGPARYAAWLAGSARLPVETIGYLGRVTGAAPAPLALVTVRPEILFVVRRAAPPGANPPLAPRQAPAMFVLRREVP
jgi:soluble lytic murein transglycosylase-like protein